MGRREGERKKTQEPASLPLGGSRLSFFGLTGNPAGRWIHHDDAPGEATLYYWGRKVLLGTESREWVCFWGCEV